MARFRGLSWSMQQRISSVGSLRVSAVTILNRYGLWVQTLISFSSKQNHHKIAQKIALVFRKWMLDIDGYWMFIPKKNIQYHWFIQYPTSIGVMLCIFIPNWIWCFIGSHSMWSRPGVIEEKEVAFLRPAKICRICLEREVCQRNDGKYRKIS